MKTFSVSTFCVLERSERLFVASGNGVIDSNTSDVCIYAVLISHAPESNEGSATIHNVLEMNFS